MSNNTITLTLTARQASLLFDKLKEYSHPAPAYARWQLRPENCVITCYQSGKTVFQGKDAQIYASPFLRTQTEPATPSTITSAKAVQTNVFPQAGSDEVGTGDYFGPVCVCATIVDESTLSKVKALGVRDSKKLSDDDIRKIGPQLEALLPHSLLIVTPAKYNQVHDAYNINAIKALLHNQAYVNLKKKYGLPSFCMIDQFTPEKSYYRYLQGAKEIQYGIHFQIKAEDQYPAVGAASVIARYAFLTTWDQMEKQWDMAFQKGAGAKVDACALAFVQKYGMEKLDQVAKLHFQNTRKLQDAL
ncbi:MAG: ribonuclease HIII [Lactimicrobium sp.]|jgi:ribonuclease HIII|uniref:ribonuclease HIII n=1 Tax=Lactimicrobium sp. TaxID=2563780 RepID=UPI002F35D0F3